MKTASLSLNNSTSVQMPILVSADIGFGVTKKLSSVFPMGTSIPSVVVPGAIPSASKLYGTPTIDENSLTVTTPDGTFHVGMQAMHFPSNVSRRTQVRDRANDVSSRVLFHTAIGLSVPHEEGTYEVFLVTGLPNDDYGLSVKTNLEQFLNQDFDITFHLSSETSITKKIKIAGLEILRQPEGSVTYNQFRFDSERFLVSAANACRLLGIIDFGHFTTDFALFQDGVIIEDETKSGSTVGMTDVYNRLKRKLVVKFDAMGYEYAPTDKDLDTAVLTGVIRYANCDYDVNEEVQACAKEVAELIAKAVLDAWGNETNRLEMILVAGGGSFLLGQYLNEAFQARKKQGFYQIDMPQFTNTIGYYMYGCLALTEKFDQELIKQHYIRPVFAEAV